MIKMRDFSHKVQKSAIVFQMKMDPDLMWERRVSTLWRGRMIKMRDFFTQSKKSVLVLKMIMSSDLTWER